MKAREFWAVESAQGELQRVKMTFDAAENEHLGSSFERVTRYVPEEELRDMFAAAALEGLLAAESGDDVFNDSKDRTRYQNAANEAYDMADAMIAARSRVKQSA